MSRPTPTASTRQTSPLQPFPARTRYCADASGVCTGRPAAPSSRLPLQFSFVDLRRATRDLSARGDYRSGAIQPGSYLVSGSQRRSPSLRDLRPVNRNCRAAILTRVLEDLLSRVPLFEKLSRRDLGRLVKAGHQVEYPADQSLTSDDEGGISFFVIVEGEARVEVKDKEVRRLGPGDYFGEMALIDRSRRSATVTAVTALKCFVMTQWQFRPFATEHPDVAWALLEAMVRRVRDAESRDAVGH